MSILFFGSSDFSLPALKACTESLHEVVVVTTPDQKKGRGLKLQPNCVKTYSLEHRLSCLSPATLKDSSALEEVRQFQPDYFVVASYGKLIPSAWLAVARKHTLNVHPSLLPKYRGASPIQAPILNGDDETGVSIAKVTAKLDSGELYAQKALPLDSRMTADQLSILLADLSYGLLKEVLARADAGNLTGAPQEETQASYAPKLQKEDGRLNFSESAVQLDRKIRGFSPWPGAFIDFEGQILHLLSAEVLIDDIQKAPGMLVKIYPDGAMGVTTGGGILKIHQVKPSGKKAMTAAEFLRGRRIQPDFVFKTV